MRHELRSGYYGTTPYFVAKALCDICAMRVLPPAIFAAAVYRLAAFHEDAWGDHFANFTAVLILSSTSFASVCLLLGAVTSDTRAATALASVALLLSLMFGGLLVSRIPTVAQQHAAYVVPLHACPKRRRVAPQRRPKRRRIPTVAQQHAAYATPLSARPKRRRVGAFVW